VGYGFIFNRESYEKALKNAVLLSFTIQYSPFTILSPLLSFNSKLKTQNSKFKSPA